VNEHVVLVVRVTPRSSHDAVIGYHNGELRVRLRAAPVDGQANLALRRFMARSLRLSPSSVELMSGAMGRVKRLQIRGLTSLEVHQRLRIDETSTS
jgi:uncharacterized protein (TIGR00251 family)